MPLAIDHRPPVLKELAGNEALKVELGAILKRPLKDIPHAFLFTGISGGGKTTLGGIVANALKCDPCEIYEVNSANFRTIDTARELENSITRYRPKKGLVRVWIMNEVHMWLAATQNAMLDLLEKAPHHCYFILTTTDPQKLVTPLKKRCVEFEVLPLSDDEMFDMLASICDKENADVPEEILEKILSVAGGSSRNALQLLEKVIDLDQKDMKKVIMKLDDEEAVNKDLFDALLKKKDWKTVAKIIQKLTAEPENIRYSILGLCNAMMLGGYGDTKQAAFIMDCFSANTYDTGKAGITMAAYAAVLK